MNTYIIKCNATILPPLTLFYLYLEIIRLIRSVKIKLIN